jgi:hypothetical protein
MKNEKMILLIQILEKGMDYFLYTVKGAELQETTVCHAEENSNVNDISKAIFEEGKTNAANYTFSLAPITEMDMTIYDDTKVSLSGIIEGSEFAELLKKAFMRILAMKIKDKL